MVFFGGFLWDVCYSWLELPERGGGTESRKSLGPPQHSFFGRFKCFPFKSTGWVRHPHFGFRWENNEIWKPHLRFQLSKKRHTHSIILINFEKRSYVDEFSSKSGWFQQKILSKVCLTPKGAKSAKLRDIGLHTPLFSSQFLECRVKFWSLCKTT